ncbi:hypothetical protein [Variovorax sp. HW608]|uniref:hypothetical protein n=1 Tax=Variovorax sp. HW608 TaxID=1034889 RepID=UPI0012FE6DEE|nr:hypothetical protein [Variovorax sp. HW608]
MNQEKRHGKTHRAALGVLVLIVAAATAHAQVAGSTLVSRGVLEVREIANGVSVKNQIFGQIVLNENGETVGRVDDVIVAPNASISPTPFWAPVAFWACAGTTCVSSPCPTAVGHSRSTATGKDSSTWIA